MPASGRHRTAAALLALSLLACDGTAPPAPPDPTPALVAAMTRGLSWLERFDPSRAAAAYGEALALAPGFPPAVLHRGLALSLAHEGPEEADALLLRAADLLPGRPEPWYLLGAHRMRGFPSPRVEGAVEAFRRAGALLPGDPDVLAGLGGALLFLGRPAEALPHLEEAAARAPFHGPALYLRAMAWREEGREEEARAELERYRTLEQARRLDIREFVYGYQGRPGLALRDLSPWLPPAPPPPTARVAFVALPWSIEDPGGTVALGDLDGDHLPDLVTGGPVPGWRKGLPGGGFGDLLPFPGGPLPGPAGDIALGDLDGDGALDAAVAGLGVVLSPGSGPRLLDPPQAAGPGPRAFADFDGDGDLDLLAGRRVLLGDGAGGFREPGGVDLPPDFAPDGVGDVDGDLYPDLVATAAGTWVRNLREGRFGGGARPLPRGRLPGEALAEADADGDGLPDGVLPGAGGTAALRLSGGGTGPALGTVRGAAFADLDGDGDLDLLLAGGGRVRTLRNDGDAAGRTLLLSLRGVKDPAGRKQGWSNARGVGTRVTVHAGRLLLEGTMGGAGPGDLRAPPDVLPFGLGAGGRADLVSLLWPDALVQGDPDLPAGRTTLVEVQRKTNW